LEKSQAVYKPLFHGDEQLMKAGCKSEYLQTGEDSDEYHHLAALRHMNKHLGAGRTGISFFANYQNFILKRQTR
jgi:hypothetical protein